MKGYSAIFLVFLILLAATPGSRAQTGSEQLKQMRSQVTEKIDGRDYYIHTVKRGQTLYMISKAYGVDVNDIIKENPSVKEGIKADQKIRIPVPGQKAAVQAKPASAKEKVSPSREAETPVVPKVDSVVVADLPCGQDSSLKKPVYRVALMLPLFLSAVDQINTVNPDPKVIESTRSFQFLPYYEGFRMALDSMQRAGMKVQMFVYDVDKDTAKTRQLLKKPELKSMDLIFGLLYQPNFQLVAAFAKKNRITLVNPISERSELVNGNPYVIKVQPPKKAQAGQLAQYLATLPAGSRILILRNGQYADHDAAERLQKECKENKVDALLVEGQEAAIGKLSKEKPNYLVAFSDNQTYVLDFLRNLYRLRNEFEIHVIGLPDWSTMESLELEYLVSLGTHIMARSFIDYDDPAVAGFVKAYQSQYKGDPELLAFQGYEQGRWFLSALQKNGIRFGRCLPEMQQKPLVSRFEFQPSKDNGFENRRWVLFKYENYRMVPVE